MKARTAAAKLNAKRGRPRKDGLREPNGRLSRVKEKPDKQALETRARRMGLTIDQARDQKAGTFIGYLCLVGPRDGLSQAQYEGAQSYIRLNEAYRRVLQSPAAIYDPEAIGGTGEDPAAYEDWCSRIKSQHKAIRDAIQQEQNTSRENLWAALQYVVLEDQHHHHMIGATRVLCNVFARHFLGLSVDKRAAS